MMRYARTLYAPPTAEPVTVAEAKSHLRVDASAEDELIRGLIAGARLWVEGTCGLSLITQTHDLTLDGFPDEVIQLPRGPVQSVSSITYIDTAGDTQTWSSSNYIVDTKSTPNRITPAYGVAYPSTQTRINTVTVRYVAGYGAKGSDVPEPIRQAIKLLVGQMYAHREPEVTGTIVSPVRFAVDALLAPYRVLHF